MVQSYVDFMRPGTQTEKDRPEQVLNHAGGYTYTVTPWQHLDRFLILGSAENTYYVKAKTLTRENAEVVVKCFAENPIRVLAAITRISKEGRAPKNDPAIFALALCVSQPSVAGTSDADRAGLKEAFKSTVMAVCRTGTHILQFTSAVNELRGWGRRAKDVVAHWYASQGLDNLAYQLVKYRNRADFTHKDALRLAHVHPTNDAYSALFKYVTKDVMIDSLPSVIAGYEAAKTAQGKQLVQLVTEFGLTHEMLPDACKDSAEVWEALLAKMPLTALVRNLGKLSSLDLLKPLSDNQKLVVANLTNQDYIQKSRVHPIALMTALCAYKKGASRHLNWKPNQAVLDGLEEAFYLSFKNVEPSGKNHLIGLDISGSMWGGFGYTSDAAFTPAEISAAMCLITARTEPNCHVVAFTDVLETVNIGKSTTLSQLLNETKRLSSRMGTTDCAVPMLYASQRGLNVDTFVVYTDNETYAGSVKPDRALRDYRAKFNKDAKLVVCGVVATEFTIADPKDPGMLDVVGFDSATPQIIGQFSKGVI